VTRAYLGLGSNLGDRRALLHHAIESLDWGDVHVVERSPVYETEPVGGPPGQPAFLNQVIAVETDLEPSVLWERCEAVEAALGRAREHEVRWGPRTVDIDLLTFGDEVFEQQGLTVPHPRIRDRAFVLVPLADIAPDLEIPGVGRVSDLRSALPDSNGVWRSD
jgi:2-amino-4-hydroxy-6-hydroxymethyldihydropteridine diphosphokinase